MLITLPFTHKDDALALKLLEWMIELGGTQKHQILLAYDVRAGTIEQVVDLADRNFGQVYRCIITEDVHDRWAPSANLIFRRASKQIQYEIKAPYWLWMEADCVP